MMSPRLARIAALRPSGVIRAGLSTRSHPRVALCELLDQVAGPVRRAPVGDDHLDVGIDRVGQQWRDRPLDGPGLVPCRDHDRNEWPLSDSWNHPVRGVVAASSSP